ncbi:MAG TPA: hypothetical protein VKV36_06355 [Acidimicrobiales bacterium]|nr:hypothetical protein [Acidimicrobiales bacterium]
MTTLDDANGSGGGLLAPRLGSCFGTIRRGGVAEACPRVVVWHGTLQTTRNGMTWQVDACERHAQALADRRRITTLAAFGPSSAAVPGPGC